MLKVVGRLDHGFGSMQRGTVKNSKEARSLAVA